MNVRGAVALGCILVGCLAAPVRSAERLPDTAYRIHAGDTLAIAVVGDDNLSQRVRVVDDGSISLPLAGVVRVGGHTPTDAAVAIAARLQHYIKAPNVTVAVQNLGDVSVIVSGAVQNPGTYTVRAGGHVSDALAAAGGIDPTIRGTYPDARLLAVDGTSMRVATEAIVRGGDQTKDLTLPQESSLYVPAPPNFQVQVLGAVDTPGTITLYVGDRLSTAIAKAGTSGNSHADLSHVHVTRTETDGTTASHEIDLYRAIGGPTPDRRYDPLLRKGDLVYIPLASRTHGVLSNSVFLLQQLVGF